MIRYSTLRACRISVRDADGITTASRFRPKTLFEAAAAAMAVFREQGWAGEPLTPRAKLRVEVTLPTVVHEVPVAAVERWMRGSSVSPRDQVVKRELRESSVSSNDRAEK